MTRGSPFRGSSIGRRVRLLTGRLWVRVPPPEYEKRQVWTSGQLEELTSQEHGRGAYEARRHRRLALLALSLLGAGAAFPAARSGVAGRVTIDGMCSAPFTHCQGDGAAATITIRRAKTRRLVRTVQTATGDFCVRLRPGRYRLRAAADSGNGEGTARVRVKRGHFRHVTIRLASPAP
jgi:hypothetical protein